MKVAARRLPLILLALAVAAGVLALVSLNLERQPSADRQAEAKQTLELDTQVENLKYRIRARNEVMKQLIAGELTLFEAAAWFRYFDDLPPAATDYSYKFQGNSKEERACRVLICWVVEEFQRHGLDDQAEEWSCRLEQQLWVHMQKNGRVVLPEKGFAPPSE